MELIKQFTTLLNQELQTTDGILDTSKNTKIILLVQTIVLLIGSYAAKYISNR